MKFRFIFVILVICLVNKPVKAGLFDGLSSWFGGLVDKALGNWVLDHATEDVNKMVDNFKKEMEQLLNEAIDKAEEFVDHTIEEIK